MHRSISLRFQTTCNKDCQIRIRIKHVGYKLLLRLIHKLPVDDAKEGVHHQEEDELPTDEFVQGALVTEICENTTDRLSLCH